MHPFTNAVITILFLIYSATSFASSSSQQKNIRLASTDWCPYICNDNKQPGFIVEYMTEQLMKFGYQLEVDVLPWSRAIALARQGRYDGLLTAVSSEAPDFHLTQHPSGTYQVCLYKKRGRDIEYVDRSSLQNRILGGIKDYGYGDPIDNLISNPQDNEKAYLISHNKPHEALIHMTDRDRIDFFAEDSAVIGHYIKQHPKLNLVEIAGCLKEIPFYTAISPNHPEKERLLKLLDNLLSDDKSKLDYQTVKRRYSN